MAATGSTHAGGAAQIPEVQVPLEQSVPTAQTLPVAHAGQVPPPQSTSVSAPFFAPSVHVGAAVV